MNLKKLEKKQKSLFLSSFVLTAFNLSACVTVQDRTTCSAAGVVSAGGICAHTQTPETSDLSFAEFLDFLEAQPERPDPLHPGQILPAKAAAVCFSAEDYRGMKDELESACRLLGRRCSKAIKDLLRNP